MRYSPQPIDRYPQAAASSLLVGDDAAWNLAWLAWDWESQPTPPDPYFTTNVRRTLQFVVASGEIDLTGEHPDNRKVRGYLGATPPEAVLKLLKMRLRERTPLFLAYGPDWLVTAEARSHLWQEPYHPILDAEIKDTTTALIVLNACK